jgi:hypothetical protein
MYDVLAFLSDVSAVVLGVYLYERFIGHASRYKRR